MDARSSSPESSPQKGDEMTGSMKTMKKKKTKMCPT